MNKTNIEFVDLETTGLNENKHEIIEIAAIKTQVNIDESTRIIKIEKNIQYKCKPTLPVEPFVAKLNGYNEKIWNNESVPLHVAISELVDIMDGCYHAGSNPDFDKRFLQKSLSFFNLNYPKVSSYHTLDVTMSKFNLLMEGKVEKMNQENLSNYYNLGNSKHRAYDDAYQCLQIFAKINNLEIKHFN